MFNKIFGKAPVVRSVETAAIAGSLGLVLYADFSTPSSSGLAGSLGAAYLWLMFIMTTAGIANGELLMRGVRRSIKSHFFYGGGLLVVAGLLAAWNAINVNPPTFFFGGMGIGAAFFCLCLLEKRLRKGDTLEVASEIVASAHELQTAVLSLPDEVTEAPVVVASASAPVVVSAPAPAPVVPLERPVLSEEHTVVKTAKVEIEVLEDNGVFVVHVVSNGLTATQLDRQDGLFKQVQRVDGVEFVNYKNFQQGVKQLTLKATGDRDQLVAALQALVASDARFS